MKITLLKLKNCLGIKEMEIKPGKITLIQGEEGKGKTSILESIEKLLYNTGKRPKFVHGDAEKAETYLLLDDGTEVKKNIKPDGKVSNVNVKTELNGITVSPQAPESFLKSLVGEKQLNPIQFIAMDEKEQADTILSLIPMNITHDDLKEWLGEVPPINLNQHGLKVCKDIYNYYYEERKKANKEVKDLSAEVETMKKKLPENYNADEWRNVSLQEKYEAISKANKINQSRERAQAEIDNNSVKVKALEDECKLKVEQLESEIKRLKELYSDKIKQQNNLVESAKQYLESYSSIDIEPLESDHKKTEEMKSYIRTYDDLKAKEVSLVDKEKSATTLNDKVEYMRTKPQMLLSKAEMPIDGLSIDDNGSILINELPIKNLSEGEKLKFVMNITRAVAGPLRIILIDGFEKLSPKGQKAFIEECSGDGFQYIITQVTDGDLRITNIDENGNMLDAETGEILQSA